MKRILTGVVVAAMFCGGAMAGPSEEGWAAYQRGDYETALKLWRPLAAQGNAFAQSNLGSLYAGGEGVPQDYVQAYVWASLAATRFPASAKDDRKQAARNRDHVASLMTPEQLAAAKKLAKAWTPKLPSAVPNEP
jgi:TPR repeat protein